MNPLNTAALANALRTELSADRAPAGPVGAAPVAFAGLLGAQQQRWSAPAGDSAAYGGSAFDVAPAQRERARPATAPTPARAHDAPAPSGGERPAARPAPAAGMPNKPTQKTAEALRDARRSEGAAVPDEDTAADAGAAADPSASAAAAPAEDAAPETQALIDWMARWGAPAAAALPGAGGGSQGLPGAALAADGAVGASAAGLPPPSAQGAQVLPAAEGAAAAAEAAALTPAAALASAARDEAVTALSPPQPVSAAPGPVATAAAAPIALPTPVDSPDFSRALASQLTTLARQGVHEAQLQLNPADMGPISVQITLDGAQAQIDFAAAHARTREALEAAWPALAASLHGAGLTLGGGGVSDQHAGAREERPAPGRAAPGTPDAADDEGPAAQRSVRIDAQRGLLDLYA